jgi:octaheme c-type cytochrome (tetrathionate reductase family)
MGVKHGDLDASLLNPGEYLDVHMGRLNFACVDCHVTKKHFIPGKVNATYSKATPVKRFDCSDCHTLAPHKDARINKHTARVACQTCHIATFAKRVSTKMKWDWKKAGDSNRKEDLHHYVKKKGEFIYEKGVIPEYYWWNGKMERYVTGDKIKSAQRLKINTPLGSREDRSAKIWPFKVHRATQIFDPINKILIPPLTTTKKGYWTTFDWNSAAKLGAQSAGLPYSGKYDFMETAMHWPINHMVTPKAAALSCKECHSQKGRLKWKELGYKGDPVGGYHE